MSQTDNAPSIIENHSNQPALQTETGLPANLENSGDPIILLEEASLDQKKMYILSTALAIAESNTKSLYQGVSDEGVDVEQLIGKYRSKIYSIASKYID